MTNQAAELFPNLSDFLEDDKTRNYEYLIKVHMAFELPYGRGGYRSVSSSFEIQNTMSLKIKDVRGFLYMENQVKQAVINIIVTRGGIPKFVEVFFLEKEGAVQWEKNVKGFVDVMTPVVQNAINKTL